jgi:hypothetical protein
MEDRFIIEVSPPDSLVFFAFLIVHATVHAGVSGQDKDEL